MLIENVDGKTPPYHVASGIGKALIATGVAREAIVVTPAPIPNTTWQVRQGKHVDDDVLPPEIWYSCSSCGSKGMITGPTCEKTQRIQHCGISEAVPTDIQRTFRTFRIAWERGHS